MTVCMVYGFESRAARCQTRTDNPFASGGGGSGSGSVEGQVGYLLFGEETFHPRLLRHRFPKAADALFGALL